MKTYSANRGEIEKKWILIDAENLVVGRLASIVAMRLRGKHLPTFTPHMDMGDNVVVINAGKVKLTGRKLDQRKFYWHTGYPGGIKDRTQAAAARGPAPPSASSRTPCAACCGRSADPQAARQSPGLCRRRAPA